VVNFVFTGWDAFAAKFATREITALLSHEKQDVRPKVRDLIFLCLASHNDARRAPTVSVRVPPYSQGAHKARSAILRKQCSRRAIHRGGNIGNATVVGVDTDVGTVSRTVDGGVQRYREGER
jgi:hypothetical protein